MASLNPSLSAELGEKVQKAPILVVGAGGIGCELLKNLVLAGFHNITVIDLDTIDVTNLNRQFLFQRRHVGMSKSKVARESVLEFCPEASVEALHDSIQSSDYGVTFFKKFCLVLNALDNRVARSHVNRMCLAADIPLVESGTAGYLGQVTVMRKAKTECYECTPKPHQKTFPGCTIRNTPSEPIHCIVWAKHLFNQLFGEADPDEDVSPDSEDPEAAASVANSEANSEAGDFKEPENSLDGNVVRISTRQWAEEHGYNAKLIFTKLFCDDIKYLLSMDKLWTKRRPPTPLDFDHLSKKVEGATAGVIHDQIAWSIQQCSEILVESINKLHDRLKAKDYKDHLVWDKDDDAAMDFVAACANLRAHVFNIAQKTRFDIKSMAGNIIPAIATTNAVIAGCIVMEALKILNGQEDKCRTVYLTRKPNPRKKILVPCRLNAPNPKCYVCSEKHEVAVKLNLNHVTLKTLEDKILKKEMSMAAPDVEIEGRGVILISSEDGHETSENDHKTLKDLGLADGAILACDDFLQDYSVKITLYHCTKFEEGEEFAFMDDISKMKPKEDEKKKEGENGNGHAKNGSASNGQEEQVKEKELKRPLEEEEAQPSLGEPQKAKKAKLDSAVAEEEIVCIE